MFSNRRFGYGSATFGYGGGRISRSFMDGTSARTSLLGLWSTARRAWSGYSGAIIRLRRSSDSTEQDFYGIGPQGEVSTADVRAWNGWNLLRQSNDFSDAVWTKSNVSLTSGGGIGPDGQNSMTTITGTGGGTNAVFAATSVAVPANTTYTYTIFLRKGTSTSPRLRVLNNASTVGLFDLVLSWTGSTPTVNTSSGIIGSPVIEEVSTGLFRVSVTFSTGAETTARFWIYSHTSTNTTSLIAGFCQLERASSFSTYEPRTATSAGDSFLVTLYDQSGLARHFTQSIATLQPIICEQGVPVTENGRLAAKFVAADARRMSIASSTAMFNALHTTGGTVLCVSRANDTAAAKTLIASRNGTGDFASAGFALHVDASERCYLQASRLVGPATGRSVESTETASGNTAQSILALIIDPDNATASSRAFGWRNGTAMAGFDNAQTGAPLTENSVSNLTLGSGGTGLLGHDGTISEVATFSTLISTADRVTLEDRAGDFYGVAVSQPITITTQPTSKLVTFGEAFTLTCEGTNVQTYNWQFRNAGDTVWSAVGVQTSTLNLVGEAAMNGREYRCVLINPNASATSNTATVTVQGIMAKVGTFNSPTATGSQAVTGVGFQPKAVIQQSALVAGVTTGAMLNVGAATATSQASVAVTSRSGVTTSETERRHLNDNFIGHEAWSGGITGVTASRTSFDADGFTFNWTTVSAGSWPLTYAALGGSTLEVNLVQCQMNGTNAAESFAHGLSGPPTAILLFSPVTAVAAPTTQSTLYFTIGAWAGGNQFGISIFSNNGVTTTAARRLLGTDHSIAFTTTAIQRALAVSSVDATNVNVSYPYTIASNQLHFYMLCLRGCKAQAGTFDANGSLDPFSISCPGITPRLFLPVFSPLGVDFLGSTVASLLVTIGASDGVNAVSCGISDNNNVTTTNTRRYQSSTTLAERDTSGVLRFEASVSFSDQSVVIDPSTTDSNYGQGGYLIIGE